MRAPNFSSTYFCHRIPPLKFEIPRIAFAIAAENEQAGTGKNRYSHGARNALSFICMRNGAALTYVRPTFHRIQNQFRLFPARHHGTPLRGPDNSEGPDGAASGLSGLCLENVGIVTRTFNPNVTNRPPGVPGGAVRYRPRVRSPGLPSWRNRRLGPHPSPAARRSKAALWRPSPWR